VNLLFALVPALLAAAPRHFDVQATFVPASKPGGEAAVAVLFTPLDPSVHINQDPAPRLKLAEQAVLVQKPTVAPASVSSGSGEARYLDIETPLRFPIAIAPGASKGKQSVKASITYFYCSKTEGWCRRGASDVEFPVLVP
jgi:hypothetical protein